jgi:peptidoglycan lytic transglycosylase F
MTRTPAHDVAKKGGCRLASPVALAAALAMAAAGEGADLADVKARGTLRVIIAADESPDTFAFTPGPRPGFERDLMERFAQLHDLRLDVVRAPGYGDRIPMLLRGEGDVIAAIFDTPDRREKVTFTSEVIPTHNVAVTLPPHPVITRLEDLRATRVGIIRGAKPAEAAAEAGVKARDLVPYEKMDDLLRALKANEVGAAVLPISELALAGKRVAGLEAGLTVGAPGTVAWAVRKEDTALRGAMDDYLANVRRSPSWSRLVVQYFGDQALAVLGRGR